MLSISHFSKSYNDQLIIAIDHLVIEPGTFWIRGENGAGKSTLLKSLAGLLPCEGDILLDKTIDIHRHPVEYRKLVNYSEAEPLFPGFLTARDLIRFAAKLKGSDARQQQHIIERLGIDQFFEKRCETYSSGMLKKVSLAVSFLGKPRVIILDEPLITLDDKTKRELAPMIEENRQGGVITLLSSHQTIEIEEMTLAGTFVVENRKVRTE